MEVDSPFFEAPNLNYILFYEELLNEGLYTFYENIM